MMSDDIDDDSGNGGGSIETAKDPDASTVVTGSSVAERAIGGGGDHNGERKSPKGLEPLAECRGGKNSNIQFRVVAAVAAAIPPKFQFERGFPVVTGCGWCP